MRSSSAMTSSASSTSWCSSASSARPRVARTMSRAPIAAPSSRPSSSTKACRVSGMCRPLPELPGDVLLGPRILRVGEDLVGLAVLDQAAGSSLAEHERRVVRHARRLLHVVRDDHDRETVLELLDELLDLQRRLGVERGGGLVHEDHVGLDRDRPRNAQPLLLAARQADPGRAQAVLDLVPQAGGAQGLLDPLADVARPRPGQPQPGCDIVGNGLGFWNTMPIARRTDTTSTWGA